MITVFTGAGASKPLGYPTTAEFFASGTAKDLCASPVYRAVAKHLKKNDLDVEDILRLLYPIAALHSTPTGDLIFRHLGGNWVGDIPGFVTNTNNACFDHYGRLPTESDVRSIYTPLLKFADWTNQRVSLFTTNYDPVTDVLMEIADAAGLPCHDGFNRLGAWDSGSYSSLKARGLAIYRLHGSMSWIESDAKIRNTRDYSRRVSSQSEHLIIYPGFKGNPEQEGNPAFRFAHTALRKDLGESTIALIIGFSFRDPHLNGIFRDALDTNQKLTLVVWNPTWPEGPDVGLSELAQSFENRVKHLACKFGDESAYATLSEVTA